MGIFSRIRRRSSAAAEAHPSLTAASTPQLTPVTPKNSLFAPNSPAPSTASRTSRNPLKKIYDEGSFKGSLSKKAKGKMRDVEDQRVQGGPEYGDHKPPPVPPLLLAEVKSRQLSRSPTPSKNADDTQRLSPHSPLAALPSPLPDVEREGSNTSGKGSVNRPVSGLPKQEGGILGRLNFEAGVPRDRQASDSSWVKDLTGSIKNDAGSSKLHLPSVTGDTESATNSSTRDMTPDQILEDPLVEQQITREDCKQEEEAMEMLESAEKKYKFWKSKGRPTRHSRAISDSFQMERPESPTPNVKLTSSVTCDLTSPAFLSPEIEQQPSLEQPRPQHLRRLSSSFFPNPFNRSVSRASERSPAVDEGNFQLRGFRHVSGMSDVEGAGELEGYLSHVKRESVFALSSSEKSPTPQMDPSISKSQSSFLPPQSIGISRPPSVAHSIASVDDVLPSSNRVSVAAFKKGLRRPSAPISTMSDIGHGLTMYDDGEDDEDIPLSRRMPALTKQKSTQSLSSLRGLGLGHPGNFEVDTPAVPSDARLAIVKEKSKTPDGREKTKTPDEDPLTFHVKPYDPGRSSRFVVKSRRSQSTEGGRPISPVTRDSPSFISSPTSLKPAIFPSPAPTRTQSPMTVAEFRYGSSRPSSVGNASPVDSYFPRAESRKSPIVKPTHLNMSKSKPDFGKHASLSPLTTAKQQDDGSHTGFKADRSTSMYNLSRPPPPPVGPIDLPQPSDKPSPTLSSLNLPLPPDLMPDTPPKVPKPLDELPSRQPADSDVPMSPSTKKRMSLLDEPIKYLSGLWGAQSGGEDGFDPVLAANSLRILGGDEVESPTAMKFDREAFGRQDEGLVNRQMSASPLPTSVAERVRSPLSERLAGVATSALSSSTSTNSMASFQKPALEKLRIGDDFPNRATQDAKSPTSDSTTSTIHRPTPRPFSNLAIARPSHQDYPKGASGSDTKGGSEMSPENQQRVSLSPRLHSRRVPSGPRQPAKQNRIVSMPITASQRTQSMMDVRENDDEDNDNVVLARLKHRTSKSSLATATMSKSTSYGQGSLPTSPTSVANASVRSANPPRNHRKFGEGLGPHVPGTPQSSQDQFSDAQSMSSRHSETSYVTSSTLSPVSMTRVNFDSPEKGSHGSRKTFKGQESSGTSRKNGDEVRHRNDRSGSSLDHRHRRQSEGATGHSSPYDPPMQAQTFAQGQQGMQQMPDSQNMTPEASFAWQKQQWQLQYMAAAFRASEEEWERQSSTSALTNNNGRSFSPFPIPSMPMFDPNMNMNMMNMNMPMGVGMPMGYGYPQTPGYPPFQGMFSPYGSMVPQDRGSGGGYSYGTGAQSAFGGGFGPPSAMPSHHSRFNGSASTNSPGIERSATHSNIRRSMADDSSPRGRSASAMGMREAMSATPPALNHKPSGAFRGLMAEREKVEMQQEMERHAQEKLRQWAKEKTKGKEKEKNGGSPPSSWARRSIDWSDDLSTPRKPGKNQIIYGKLS